MPFALVIIGLVLIVTGAKDTYQQLGRQVVGDFTGPNNFTYWLAAMGAVGAVGYIESLKILSRTFLALIIIAMVLKNGGVFNKLSDALNKGPIAPHAPSQAPEHPAADMLASAVAAGVELQSDTDVVVRAQHEAAENRSRNFGDVMALVGKFFFGGPAY